MFFNEGVVSVSIPEVFQTMHREINRRNFDAPTVPSCTEDGITIRKLYVTNLPPKTTRTDLFGVFAQFGYVKSCWLRTGEKGPNKTLSPTYAFITYIDPSHANRALQSQGHERLLYGRVLRVSPADSWHQPVEDSSGRVIWFPNTSSRNRNGAHTQVETVNGDDNADFNMLEMDKGDGAEATNACLECEPNDGESEGCYNPLEILNSDCLRHILSYIPLIDLIKTERVSKNWQNMLNEYYQGIRFYKTSSWDHNSVVMTTAVLRRILQRLDSVTRLHVDHKCSALNDRIAHTIGRFCPLLEELLVCSMNTPNWNPVFYRCKQLRSVSFVACSKVTDTSLAHLVKNDSCIEYLNIANNSNVTGLFLTGVNPPNLTTLIFHSCFSLQGSVLKAAADSWENLTVLKLDACPLSLWRNVPDILKKVPKLQELSLSSYTSVEGVFVPPTCENLCEVLPSVKELKIVNFSKNIYITNSVIKQLAKSCPKLESLNVAACNTRRSFSYSGHTTGVSDEGIIAVCRACPGLQHLDISYLGALTEAGVAAAAQCPMLRTLRVRGNRHTAYPFIACLQACHALEELDVCGCDNVSEVLVEEARIELKAHPRPLLLRIGGTQVTSVYETDEACRALEETSGGLLRLNTDDLCITPLRPDFVDDFFDDNSDYSFDFDEMHGSDEELYDEDDDIDDFDVEYDLEEYEYALRENLLPFDLNILHGYLSIE